MDVERIIDELHLYEKKVLKALEKLKPPISPEDIVKSQNMDIKAVMSAIGSLESKGLVSVHKKVDKLLKPTKTSKKYAIKGVPERQILQLLSKEGPLKISKIMEKSGLDKTEAKIAIGWLMRKKWATIKDNTLKITSEGKKSLEKLGADEILLQELAEKGQIRVSSLPDELKEAFKLLNQRKGLLEVKKVKEHGISLTDKGRTILERGLEIREEATQLTHEDLKTGRWKKLYYRGYDIHAEYPIIFPGKMHPLKRIIEEIRDIFLKMGFTEARGPIIESAFWNFDCLFQPQDHAAREMQDTFYVKNPPETKLPSKSLVDKVRMVHEDGGPTGSEGWQYKWDVEIAKKSVLRTHTTCVSARFLLENKPPLKMFSIGRVFRRETITYKHLPEFHQVEGIVAAENVTFKNLLGILREFYRRLGFKVRFRPAYFPYTYLSTECEIYLPEKETWIELGGAGMFRPEVLEPLQVETPVAAFGLGIERLAMIRLGIEDIRMLYQSNLGWLRSLPICRGGHSSL